MVSVQFFVRKSKFKREILLVMERKKQSRMNSIRNCGKMLYAVFLLFFYFLFFLFFAHAILLCRSHVSTIHVTGVLYFYYF